MSPRKRSDSESSSSSSESSSSSDSGSSSSSGSSASSSAEGESSPQRQRSPSPKRRRQDSDVGNKEEEAQVDNEKEEDQIPDKPETTSKGDKSHASGDDKSPEAGPAPTSSSKNIKAPKSIDNDVFLKLLPFSESYERSYMHRDSITHVLMTPKTNFLITASIDGVLKFWKKKPIGIEFVIKFRAHLSSVNDMTINPIGTMLATISDDYNLKMFDVINFDMINMIKLDFKPGCVEWCYSKTSKAEIAVSDKETNKIYIFDEMCQQMANPLMVLEKHPVPVVRMRFNAPHNVMVSIDRSGVLNYWAPYTEECRFPSQVVRFRSQMDTDLYEMAKAKTYPHDIAFSPDGNTFATICADRKVRVFSFKTGKLLRVLNETLQAMTELQQNEQQLPNMEFGRRMAIERDLEKSGMFQMERIVFDCGGNYLIYPNMFGIKIINWRSGTLAKMIGKGENFRPLAVTLCQEKEESKYGAVVTPEMLASENPNIARDNEVDPTAFCTGFRKNRFYLFTKREPDDSSMAQAEEGVLTGLERDVFNEKPTQEDMIAATATDTLAQRKKSVAAETAIMHTSMGDIHIKLFPKQCPKSVENFVTHSRNGYYNGHIFHRVIRRFMIQTGDPTGTGTGGESIWGGEFEDEICDELRHDKPFTLSMANAGANTNGSQFFITVIPTPWLDGKHTVFGRVTKGMDIVQNISQVRTHPKTDKPFDDIKIVNIQIK